MAGKHCTKCGEFKANHEFAARRNRKSIESRCNSCKRVYAAARRAVLRLNVDPRGEYGKLRTFPPIAERFESKVERIPESGCWIWTGAGSDRYGHFKFGKRLSLAHRASYAMFVGPVPDGMEVCHKCDIGWCVNPTHLFLGTHTENMQDAVRKGRIR